MKNIINYVYEMGFRWLLFRIKYYLRLKYNFFVRNDDKILQNKIKVIEKRKFLDIYNVNSEKIILDSRHIEIAENAIKGKIFVFSNQYLDYGNPKKSHYSPITKYEIDKNLHWSKIPDFGKLGDIKIPWEYSRFPHFFSYIKAHKITNEKKYVNAFKSDLTIWIDENQYPNGINYKCGQEMTFRLYSIIISINYFYKYLEKNFLDKIYLHLSFYGYRIKSNIDYAVISVKNDHAISEAVGLILCGFIFKNSIDDSVTWFNEGKRILIKELSRQVYFDGSYLCHSFNYQREVIDELSFLLLILQNNSPCEKELIKSISMKNLEMIKFLNSFIQSNGYLPNYGSNDGAYLFPVSESDYSDYRDSLNFAYGVISGNRIFEKNTDLLDFFSIETSQISSLTKEIRFNEGGYYILKNDNIFSFIRCHKYKDRPSQNDMFHLDIWYKSKNIFCDTGTFSYNTQKEFKDNFQGVKGHNTIIINNTNQMEQVLNFGWSNWTTAKHLNFTNSYFSGKNYAYKKKFGITQEREIKIKDNKLIVIDKIKNINSDTNIKQAWNTNYDFTEIDENTLKIDNCIISSNIKYKIEKSYISNYYNSYVEGSRILFEVDTNKDLEIKTIIEFKD